MSIRIDIQSPQNPRVKQVLKLRKKRHREESGLFIIDGLRDLMRAVELGVDVREVYMDPASNAARDADVWSAVSRCGLEPVVCSRSVLDKMAYRENPEGVVAVAASKPLSLCEIVLPEKPFLLIADRLEKPGNIGALLRSADAAGVDAVILSDCVTDLYNPNIIRSSTGTLFSQPVISAEGGEVRTWLKEKGIKTVITRPDADRNYMEADLTPPLALVLGAEDDGLAQDWLTVADQDVFIPMKGLADSLNVSAAGTLLLYESVRQTRMSSEQKSG